MEDVEEDTLPPSNVRCELCGSDSFVLQGGHYFCQICQTQSQDVVEYVAREEFQQGRLDVRSSTLHGTEKRSRRGRRSKLENLSTFEAFNCCLKLTTDRVIDMGFPASLRDKVFALWTRFLIRRQAILVQVSAGASVASRCRNSASAAGAWISHRWRLRRKRKVRGNNKELPGLSTDDDFLSVTIQKRKRTLAQKKAMETSYMFQLAELMDEELPDATTKMTTIQQRRARRRQQLVAAKLTKQSKQVIWASRRQGLSQRSRIPQLLLQPEVFTMKSLLSLIFISLRQIGCKVLMTDVIRMIWSGSIHFSSLRLILGEESANISAQIDRIFSNSKYNFISTEYSDAITNLITYIGIPGFRYPRFDEFLPKFIDDLNLPRELECLIIQMQKILPADSPHFFEGRNILSTYQVLPEFHIIAVIIVVLRLLFGLDDVTERYQSEFAKKVNSTLKTACDNDDDGASGNTEWTQLFVIEDWFSYLRQRRDIIKSELFNPSFYKASHNNNPSSTAVDNFVEMYTGYKGINYARGPEEEKRLETAQIFNDYARLNKPAKHTASSSLPGYSCISLPQENIYQQYKANHPCVLNQGKLLDKSSSSLVDINFSKKRIDFILNPTKYVKLLKNQGYSVRVRPGDSRPYTIKEEKEINLFQPFKSFDDHMPKNFCCPSSLKFIVQLCSSMLSGRSFDATSCNEKFEALIESVQYFYSRHLKFGVLNISPYDLSDNDAQSDSD